MTSVQDKAFVSQVKEYYRNMGMNAVLDGDIFGFIKAIISGDKNNILVSSYKLIRGAGRFRGVKRIKADKIVDTVDQYFALKDAFLLLAKKGVPVYFYNRVGLKKDGYPYSESAVHRMDEKLSFPKMYEDIFQYKDDLKEIFGDSFSIEYVQQIGKIPQVIKKGNIYCHEDYKSRYVNVINGKRITCFQPKEYDITIHVYGRCGAFGYAVEDAETLPSLLQKKLYEKGIENVRVVNHGLWGGIDSYVDHNFLQDAIGMGDGDIVLFYRKHFDNGLMAVFESEGVWYKDITGDWHEHSSAKNCFFDKPGHMNSIGYNIAADILCRDLIEHGLKAKKIDSEKLDGLSTPYLNSYLKSHTDTEFQDEIQKYVSEILLQYPSENDAEYCGAIVMNCNPFTKGHRYLIEYASKKVDRLYVFVVEEDKSFFRFTDRIEMVRKGTSDIENVVVIPSGKFIISSFTFPEYFMKDYVKEKNFDVSMDLQVFCEYISPPLSIKVRFAGEEPFDQVTLNYNENMAKILPEFGMKFCEIPRYTTEDGRIINATEVRQLLKEKNYEPIKEYVPETTFSILMERYSE